MTYFELINQYEETGIYEKVFNLAGIKNVDSSSITWTGTALVETKVTGGAWITVNSGDAISGLPSDFLAVKITLTRTSLLVSPEITNATVEIVQDGEVVFYGVVGIPESPTYSSGFETDIYNLQIQSANALLRRRTISEAYQNKTTPEIIQDIFTKYIESEGVTLGAISAIEFTYDIFVAQRKYVADVLDELVAPVGATWHISPDKKFYFLTKEDFTTIGAPTHLSAIKKSVSGLDTRTVQIIAGATAQTDTQTETTTWAADTKQILANFPLVEEPTITINGTPATVGLNGLESDDVTKTFLWANQSNFITLNTLATVKPATGDTVVINYIGVFEIEVENQNTLKIAEIKALTGTSGRIEKVETDTTIKTYGDGNTLANKLLDRYGESEETITCFTDNLDDTDLLNIWTFALTDQKIVGDYIIVERTIRRLTDEKPAVELVLKNKQFFLKYGTIYNKYDKNIRRLSVSAKSVIIKTENSYNEVLSLGETWEQAGLVFYPTTADFSDPTALFYPMELQA